ncbi:hypothetical protein ASG52_24380 [Methylobacterium sp. Leaf456]|uniref:hypothetical protein n=1 Tax=Methylobacterium sp. Leaf456 TaxID=1736382 RepID=UPI0006F87161|nr:hypothetical protein [Methylobacterium sp. Leaf456]KQT56137.1 hypothetical protein ASG52_24380 [Methylobacterium sp. Leaf456]
MRLTPITAAFLACTILVATPALAITVTNQDKGEHTLTVDKGEAQATQKLAAGASAEVECKEGCELRVAGSGYGRSVEKGDKLVIAGGMIRFSDEDIVTGSTKPTK